MRIRAPDRWQAASVAAVLLVGPLAGALAVRKPALAVGLIAAISASLLLAYLGDRALPWFVVGVAVLPWYPIMTADAEPPVVPQWVFCLAVALAALAPWLWSVSARVNRTRWTWLAPLLGVLLIALHVSIYSNASGVSSLITAGTVSVLVSGIVLLCARRNAQPEMWPVPCFAGLLLLIGVGLLQLAAGPTRVAAGTGYPITYGALVVALLPGALAYAARRSPGGALVLAAAAGGMLVASQSRSSWVAAGVMFLIMLLVLARQGQARSMGLALLGLTLVLGLVLTIGPLRSVVAERLSSRQKTSLSVTHRTWSAGYAFDEVKRRPAFGVGQPGFAGQQAASITGVGAIDNGYLSIAVDLGLLGLLIMLVPLGIALRVLGLALLQRRSRAPDIALALGIVGVYAVTAFYDSFYWAQLNLLLFGMAGVLSTVPGKLFAPARVRAAYPTSAGAVLRPET